MPTADSDSEPSRRFVKATARHSGRVESRKSEPKNCASPNSVSRPLSLKTLNPTGPKFSTITGRFAHFVFQSRSPRRFRGSDQGKFSQRIARPLTFSRTPLNRTPPQSPDGRTQISGVVDGCAARAAAYGASRSAHSRPCALAFSCLAAQSAPCGVTVMGTTRRRTPRSYKDCRSSSALPPSAGRLRQTFSSM